MKRRNYLVTSILLFSSVLSAAERSVYVLSEGETLSQVASRAFPGRIYGRHGSLQKLLTLNPSIENRDRIYAGQKIIIFNLDSSLTLSNQSDVPAPARELATTVAAVEPTEPVVELTAAPPKTPAPAKTAVPTEPATPSAKPAPEKTTDPKSENVDHRAKFFAGYRFTTLHAVDKTTNTNADLFTSHDVVVGSAWQQKWSEEFGTFFEFSARNLDFVPSASANKNLVNTSKTLFSLSVGGQSQLSERISLRYSMSYGSQLFIRGVNSNSISVDSLAVPSIGAEGLYRLFAKGRTSLGLAASASYLFATEGETYNALAGSLFGGALYLRRENLEGKALSLKVGYQVRNQETSALRLSERGAYGLLMFSIPFAD